MPDTPETVAEELKSIAEANVEGLDGFKAEETVEWDAAQKIGVMGRALLEIKDGATDPKAVAAVALMSVGASVTSSD